MHPLLSERPLVMAHRGYRARYPENTIPAFKAAFDAGAHVIEVDTTLTKDRQVVVIHDDNLKRTTNGSGKVCRYTLQELRQLDAGSWFHPRFAHERLPVLEEVLDLADDRGLVNIELKPYPFEGRQGPTGIEQKVLDVLHRENALDRVLISSFDPDILSRIAAVPDYPPLALITKKSADSHTVDLCKQLKAFSFHPKYSKLNAGLVTSMHQAGIKVFPFTVNTNGSITKLLHMDVDGFITDDPALVRKHVLER
jgi:glycerophosphoryl diester phosphodiesterase